MGGNISYVEPPKFSFQRRGLSITEPITEDPIGYLSIDQLTQEKILINNQHADRYNQVLYEQT